MSARPSDGLSFSQLNAEQLRGYGLAVEERRSMLISGEAGTGKSTLVNFVVEGLTEKGLVVALTAYNGIAALNIGGTTLCKWTGFGQFNEPARNYAKRKWPPQTWKDTDVLIIDEISVVSAEVFDKIDILARHFRKDERPFGGMQIIAMGDFFQLPPVPPHGGVADFCFTADAWKKTIQTYVILSQVIRQQNAAFVEMLREVRMGTPSQATIAALNERVLEEGAPVPEIHGVRPTIIYSYKKSVEGENKNELAKLPGKTHTYNATSSFNAALDGKAELDAIMRNCQATQVLEFKKHAQVMLVANIDPSNGLVNGSRGVVTKLRPGYVKVRFDNGYETKITPHSWTKEHRTRKANIVLGIIAMYRQIPLILAWAITAHKSQGLTISCALVDTTESFANGQTYVALSRVTTLEGLFLAKPFKRHHAKTDPRVIAFYKSIAAELPPEILISSSDEDEDDPPLFSPHFGVTVPECFESHSVCSQCSFVFCATCLKNADDFCPVSKMCRKCKESHAICDQCQRTFCEDCGDNSADYCWEMVMCYDCVVCASDDSAKRRRLK